MREVIASSGENCNRDSPYENRSGLKSPPYPKRAGRKRTEALQNKTEEDRKSGRELLRQLKLTLPHGKNNTASAPVNKVEEDGSGGGKPSQ
jgi:hypothetical protein